jgi:hypothetical protein
VRAFLLGALLLAPLAAAGTAVNTNGVVAEGEIRLDGDDVVQVRAKREIREPKGDFLLVESDDGKLLWTPDLESRLRGYEYLARMRGVERATKLLKDALAARDTTLARKLLDLAEAEGLTGKEADDLKRRLEQMEQRPHTPDEKKAAAVSEALKDLGSLHADLLVERARADDRDGLRLLREALRLDPKNAPALALVTERAPKDFRLGPPTLWLDWHLDLEERGAWLIADGDPELLAMKRSWRKDLYALEAGPIRIVTPLTDTATVGRCLAHGQLVCKALAELFRTAQPKPRMTRALTILLYPSKKEYIENSRGAGEEAARSFLEATAGHYSPSERLSRVVWDKSPDAERRIARVFVHELTHHWLTELNPRFTNAELRLSPDIPGYWIVEGFAVFIEEATFDVDRGVWSYFDSRARSLDCVNALVKRKLLLPWASIYAMDYEHFTRLSHDGAAAHPLVRRWHMGKEGLTDARIFYEQAAATVHFLFHGEGGKYRQQLLDYVTSQYTGKRDRLTIAAAFGMSADDLGRRVEAYAQKVAEGWRPEGS